MSFLYLGIYNSKGTLQSGKKSMELTKKSRSSQPRKIKIIEFLDEFDVSLKANRSLPSSYTRKYKLSFQEISSVQILRQ